jgi:hypothetical protein
MPRNVIVGILIVAALTACATLPKPNPRMDARLLDANTALDSLSTDTTTFHISLETLLRDIRAIYDHPGWSDMEAIIASAGPADEWEDDFSVAQGMEDSLDEWTVEWGDSGEALFLHYRSLVDRCSISEARRIGLIGRIASLQAIYLEVTFLELAADRYSQAETIFGTVEALSKAENELNSYSLNPLGLYDVKPSR